MGQAGDEPSHSSGALEPGGGERGEASEGGQEARTALWVTQLGSRLWDSLNLACRPSALHFFFFFFGRRWGRGGEKIGKGGPQEPRPGVTPAKAGEGRGAPKIAPWAPACGHIPAQARIRNKHGGGGRAESRQEGFRCPFPAARTLRTRTLRRRLVQGSGGRDPSSRALPLACGLPGSPFGKTL